MAFQNNIQINSNIARWAQEKAKESFFQFSPNISKKYNLLELITVTDDFEIIFLSLLILIPQLAYKKQDKSIGEYYYQNFSNQLILLMKTLSRKIKNLSILFP